MLKAYEYFFQSVHKLPLLSLVNPTRMPLKIMADVRNEATPEKISGPQPATLPAVTPCRPHRRFQGACGCAGPEILKRTLFTFMQRGKNTANSCLWSAIPSTRRSGTCKGNLELEISFFTRFSWAFRIKNAWPALSCPCTRSLLGLFKPWKRNQFQALSREVARWLDGRASIWAHLKALRETQASNPGQRGSCTLQHAFSLRASRPAQVSRSSRCPGSIFGTTDRNGLDHAHPAAFQTASGTSWDLL